MLVNVPIGIVGLTCAVATSDLAKVHIVAQCPSSSAIFSSTVAVNDVAAVLYGKMVNPKERAPRRQGHPRAFEGPVERDHRNDHDDHRR